MKTSIIIIAVVILVAALAVSASGQLKVEKVQNCKVLELQQQQLVKGSGKSLTTEIRYLVITNNETFVCQSSLLNGKFNNSDMFFRLKKDSTYTFKVAGFGKTMFTDYRNIIEVEK